MMVMRIVVIGMLITIALSTAIPAVEVAWSAAATTRAGQSAAREGGRVAEALAANERILLPAVDLILEDVEAVGITGQPAYAAVADSASAPAVDETFVRKEARRGQLWQRRRTAGDALGSAP